MAVPEATVDPDVMIEARGPSLVRYVRVDGARWEIRGTCNQCGECEIGAINSHIVFTGIPVGQPGACFDDRGEDRPDNPVTPDMMTTCPSCTLTGEWL